MKKAILISAITVGVLSLIGVLAVNRARADESFDYPPIIQKLVERFNLNTEEVQQVFDEVREERQEQGRARFEERLNQAVSDGRITEAQKEAILAKHAEMQANQANHRQEMQAWAEENGIDWPLFLGGGHRGGFGKPFSD